MDADGDPTRLERRYETGVHVVGVQGHAGPEGFCRGLQFREMVHPLLDEVTDLLRRQPGGFRIEALAIAELGREGAEAVLGMLVGPVQLEDAPGQIGTVLDELAHVLGLESHGLEEGIAKGLHEVVG